MLRAAKLLDNLEGEKDKRLEDMSIDELRAKRAEYVEQLEEYHEERDILLGQTGQHIGSTGIVSRYAALVKDAEESIAEVDRQISKTHKP